VPHRWRDLESALSCTINDISTDSGRGERAMMLVVLAFDCSALATLSLVPLARPLGLADVDVPASAVAGWFFMAAPLALGVGALIGRLLGIARLDSVVVVQSAFAACALASVLTTVMAVGVTFSAGGDAIRMRGFAIAAAALFALNLLVLWRAAFTRAR